MFSELPKLFDRNFALGYFLPSALYIIATLYLLDTIGMSSKSFLQQDLLIGTTTIGVISWLFAILLLGFNNSVYRLLEGYGRYNPLRIFLRLERWKFNRTIEELNKLNEKYYEFQARNKELPIDLRIKRNRTIQKLAEKYPDRLEWILPTPFGNTIRAFEVYPRVVYGIEAIQGWNRLLAVIPVDYRNLIDGAKAQVDFWLNLGLLSYLILVQHIIFTFLLAKEISFIIIIVTMIFSWLSAIRAENSAVLWGEFVKSAFDVFLPKLKQELDMETIAEENKNFWNHFSQIIVYRMHPQVLIDKAKKNKK